MPSNFGNSSEVVVISSEHDSTLIVNNLQAYNYVPQREGIFTFLFVTDTAFVNYNKFHTILMCGSLQDEFISALLSAEAREATRQDTFILFKLRDRWVKGQLTIILAASKDNYVASGVKKYNKVISQILLDNYYQRIKDKHYRQGVDIKIKNQLKRFGVVFDFDKGWSIDSTSKAENFLSVHTHFPDRSIFFHKQPSTENLTESLAISKRNALTRKYYNGDYILNELTTAEQIVFQGMKGIRLTGVWQNDSLIAGGPFFSYFLKNNDTLYIADGLLFNPGARESDYFTKLEVILNSLRIMHP